MTGKIDVPATMEFVDDFQRDFPEGSPSAEAMKKRKVAKNQYIDKNGNLGEITVHHINYDT